MVQKIQNLAMDSIDHKSKVELLMNNHRSLTSEMKSLKTKYEQQEERIAAIEDQNVKLNEHVHQLLQHQDVERNRTFLLKQDAIEKFEENETFQALWNNINETFTWLKKVEDSVHNVSYAFNETCKSVLRSCHKLPLIQDTRMLDLKEIDSEDFFLIFFFFHITF